MSCLFYILTFPFFMFIYAGIFIMYISTLVMNLLCHPLKWIVNKLYNYYSDQNPKADFFKLGEFSFANPDNAIFKYNKREHTSSFEYEEYKHDIKQSDFDKEADLWGLSEEERRIAKEERMSPAEFIEAEEYDDDELSLDEWER